MVYESYIEQAKKLLSQSSAADDALKTYYSNARASINSSYDDSLKLLQSQYFDDKNAAGAQSMLDAKNMDQYLAARGLSRSGESIQAQIGGNVALNNSLSQLAKSNYKTISELTQQKNSLMTDLEGSYANLMYDKEKWANQLAFDIASAELAAAQYKDDQARQDRLIEEQRAYDESVRLDEQKRSDTLLAEKNIREDELIKNQREYEELLRQAEIELEAALRKEQQEYEQRKLEEERAYKESQLQEQREYEQKLLEDQRLYDEKLLAEKREYEQLLRQAEAELEAVIRSQQQADKERLIEEQRAYEEKMLAEKRAYEESQKSGSSSGSGSNTYQPDVVAKDLAKTIVNTYASGGDTIKTTRAKVNIYNYIEELRAQNTSEAYLKDLMTNLTALGYKEPTETTVKALGLADASYSTYKSVKSQYKNFYLHLGYTDYESDQIAEEAAKNIRLDYIYKRCDSPAMFTAACDALGVSASERNLYYKRIASINANKELESIYLGMLL